jgi:hypothetical protein
MIPYWLSQCRRLIQSSGGELPQIGRAADDPERLAGVERGARGNAEELLAQLEAEAQKGAAAIRAFSDEERGKKAKSPRWGEITVGDSVERFIVVHAGEHLQQIKAALRQ